jgi:hypothetical protein
VFYKAVKDADPAAVVVLAGSDGLFDPTGTDSPPGQEANIAFFKTVLSEVHGAFDIFDIHLYGNPYTIPARIELVQKLMSDAGAERPVIAAEYGGPGFFDFKANRRWYGDLTGLGATAEKVRNLRQNAEALPPETRMFLTPDDPELSARLGRLQAEDVVARNMLALSHGVIRTAFFSVWHDTSDRDAPNTVLFGSFSLFNHDGSGLLTHTLPRAFPLARLAAALKGQTKVQQLMVSDHPDFFAFRVERVNRPPLLIAWRRSLRLGDPSERLTVSLPWAKRPQSSATITGETSSFTWTKGNITLSATDMPVLIE